MASRIFYSHIFIIFIFSIVHFSLSSVSAEENVDNSKWKLKIGAKGSYSSKTDESYQYYNPYAEYVYSTKFISLSAGGSYCINYQIVDSEGNYDYINVYQLSPGIKILPTKKFELYFDYEYNKGDSEFIKMDYLLGMIYEFKKVSLIGEYGLNNIEYDLNSEKITNNNYDFHLEIDYEVSDSTSIDLSYDHYNNYYKTLDYEYYKNIIRLGFLYSATDTIFTSAGLSAGFDVEEYAIFGLDLGVYIYFNKNIKLSTIYIFTYNNPIYSFSQSSTGSNGQNSPIISTDVIGEPYQSHLITINISYTFKNKKKITKN